MVDNQLLSDEKAGNYDLERRLTETGNAILLTSDERRKLEALVELIETAFKGLELAKRFITLHSYPNFSVKFEKCRIVGSVYKRTAIWSDYDLDTVCEFELRRKNQNDMMDLSILANACINKLRKNIRKLVKPLSEKGVELEILSNIRCGKMVRVSWKLIKIEVDLLFAFQDIKHHHILDTEIKTPKLLYPSLSRLSATSIRNLRCHPAIGLLKLWEKVMLKKRFISDKNKNAQEHKAQRMRSVGWELLAFRGERKGKGGNLGLLREVWKFLAELDLSNGARPSVVDFRPRENGILSYSYWEENKSSESWSKFSGTQLELSYVSGPGGSISSKSHFLVIKDPMDEKNDLMTGFHKPELLRDEARRSLEVLESDMMIVDKLKSLFGDIPKERFCNRTLIDKISIHSRLIPRDYCLRRIEERHDVVLSSPNRVDRSEVLSFGIYAPTEEAMAKATVAVMNEVKKWRWREMCTVLAASWKRYYLLCFAFSPLVTRINSAEGHPKVVSYCDQEIEIGGSNFMDLNKKYGLFQGEQPIIGSRGKGGITEMLLQAIQDIATNIPCSPSRNDPLKIKVLLGKMQWRTAFQFNIGGFSLNELKNFHRGHGLRVSMNSHIAKTCIDKIKHVIRANHKELGAHCMIPEKKRFGVKFIHPTDPNDPVKEWKAEVGYDRQPQIRKGIMREVRWLALSELHQPTSLDLRFNITSRKQLDEEIDITSDEREIVESANYSELAELVDVPADKVGKKYVLWSYKRKERFICGQGNEAIKISIREVIGSEYEAFGVNISHQWLNQLLLEPLAKKDKILKALNFFYRWLKDFLSYIEK